MLDATDIEALLGLRELTRDDLLARLGIAADDVDDGYRYQSLDGLAMARTDEYGGARLFFAGERLAVIALASPDVAPATLRSLMGPEIVELPSRQGKTAILEVDAGTGLAFSADDDEVAFVEVFPPTTAEDYRQRIYWDPGPFTR